MEEEKEVKNYKNSTVGAYGQYISFSWDAVPTAKMNNMITEATINGLVDAENTIFEENKIILLQATSKTPERTKFWSHYSENLSSGQTNKRLAWWRSFSQSLTLFQPTK